MGQALSGLIGVVIGAIITAWFGFWRFREEQRLNCIKQRQDAIAKAWEACNTTTTALVSIAFPRLQFPFTETAIVRRRSEQRQLLDRMGQQHLQMIEQTDRFKFLTQLLLDGEATKLADHYWTRVNEAADRLFQDLPGQLEAKQWEGLLREVQSAQEKMVARFRSLYETAESTSPASWPAGLRKPKWWADNVTRSRKQF